MRRVQAEIPFPELPLESFLWRLSENSKCLETWPDKQSGWKMDRSTASMPLHSPHYRGQEDVLS